MAAPGRGQAEARRHGGAGQCRCRSHDRDLVVAFRADEMAFGVPQHAIRSLPAAPQAGRRRERGQDALGLDGDDRHRPADGVRQRRQPAAGARGRTPAGIRHSRGSRRALDSSGARAARREPDARLVGRCTRSGARLRRPARARGDRALGPASAFRDLDRHGGPRLRRVGVPVVGTSVRAHPDPQVRRTDARDSDRWRRPRRKPDARAPAFAARAGRRADGAGAGAARQLGPDDPQFPGAPPRRARVYRARARPDIQPLDPADTRRRSGAPDAHATRACGQARGHSWCGVGGVHVPVADGHEWANQLSLVRRGKGGRRPDAAQPTDQVRVTGHIPYASAPH